MKKIMGAVKKIGMFLGIIFVLLVILGAFFGGEPSYKIYEGKSNKSTIAKKTEQKPENLPLGTRVSSDNIEVTVFDAKISDKYIDCTAGICMPYKPDKKDYVFLWVYLSAKNTGKDKEYPPKAGPVLWKGQQFEKRYFGPSEDPYYNLSEYSTIDPIYPNAEKKGYVLYKSTKRNKPV